MSRGPKKSAAVRRTSHTSRGAVRGGTPAAKMAGSRKAPGEGVMPGMTSNKKTTQRQGFKTNEFIVYPAHGVGQIIAIEEQEVAGAKLELFVINFIKDKMTLRVPTAKIVSVGMRKLAEASLVKRALETLKGRARIKRTMWSRRAQEYEAKINSGDLVSIAEVVRDLHRAGGQAHRGVHVIGAPDGHGQRGEDDGMRPGYLVAGQQGERLLQSGDRLRLAPGVPQGARAPVEHQRAPDGVALGWESGQGLVEQGQRAVDGARLVGGLAGQARHLGLVQAGALLRVGDPGPDLQRPLQVALRLGRGERRDRKIGRAHV